MMDTPKLQAKLREDMDTLAKLEKYLRESAEIVRALNFQSLDSQGYREIEALRARFERAQNFFVTKALRTIDLLEGEEGMPIDVLNRSEKSGLIESASEFMEIRRLRNKRAHEYAGYGPEDVARDVLHFVPAILSGFESTRTYANRPEFRIG